MSNDSNKASKNWFARHKILTVIGGVFILLTLVSILSSGGDTGSTSSQDGNNQEQAQAAFTVGDMVTVGDIKWTVTDARTASSLSGAFGGTETTQGKFVVINVTVENLGKDMKTVSNLNLVDNQGREYTNSTTSFKNLGAEQLYIIENINPNLPFSFADVYEVPADAEGLSVVVGDLSLFGSDEAEIELGF